MRYSAISLSLTLIAATCVPLSAAERITVELRPGEGVTCSELTTPQPWAVPSYVPDRDAGLFREEGFHRSGANFEFRLGEKLLVGIFTGSRVYYSPDRYAVVQQSGKLALTPATETEWQSARVMPQSQKHPGGAKNPLDGQPLEYAGRSFAPPGRYWWDAIYSSFMSADFAWRS